MITRHPLLLAARDFVEQAMLVFDFSPMPGLLLSPQERPTSEPRWPFISLGMGTIAPDGLLDRERLVALPTAVPGSARSWERAEIRISAYAPSPASVWQALRAYGVSSKGSVYLARAGLTVRDYGQPVEFRDEMDGAGARVRGDWVLTVAGPATFIDLGADELTDVRIELNGEN